MLCAALAATGLAAPPAAISPVRRLPGTTQSLQYGFRSYGAEQGLLNVAINAIAQDASGFLWVATEGGLFRFDGERFQAFGPRLGSPDSDIQRLSPAEDGSIWALTARSLFRVGRGGPESAISLDPAMGRVQELLNVMEGLWLGGSNGLFLRGTDGIPRKVAGIPPGAVSALGTDPAGRALLVGTTAGQLARRDANGAWTARALPPAMGGEAPTALLEDALGRIWVRSVHRMIRLETFDGPVMDFSPSLPGPAVREGVLSLDPRGGVWTATDAGLVKVEGDQVTVLDERAGLPRHWALVTFVDREGSLWCSGDGLHRLLGRQVWGGITRKQGLPSDPVWAILRDRRGALWVGTHRGLARILDGKLETEPGTKDRGFFTLGEDSEGGLMAAGGTPPGSPASSILYREPGGRAFRVLPVPGVSREAMWGNLVWDPGGFWWAGSQNAGLHTLRIRGTQVEARRVVLPVSPAPSYIIELVRDRDSRLWAATKGGTFWLDGRGWHPIGPVPGLRDATPSHLAPLPDGRMAMSYWQAPGIAILAPQGAGFTVVDHIEPPGEGGDWAVMSLAPQADGTLWIGTSQGVCRWDGRRLERFRITDGLPGEDANSNAIWVEPGAVWVGLNAGLARGDLSVPRIPLPPPFAVILDARDGAGRPLATDGDGPRLRYRDRPVAFTFTAPGYQGPGRQKVEVRLEGFENAWRPTEVREARYTGLPPGRYTFQVRAAHAGGEPGPVASLAFSVLPPWWRTWWAGILIAGAAAGSAIAVIRWRTRWLQRRNRALDALVRLKTEDLQTSNKALVESNRALSEASMVDALTGLKNRRFLAFHLPEEVARVQRSYRTARKFERLPKGEDMVFYMVDLDHFKTINDTYGHAAGDAVLRQTAELLRAACRESDTVARWGGEEFLVLARRTDRATAHVIARNIRERMSEHRFDLGDGRTLRRTCSVGFVPMPFFPGDAEALGWEQVMELADQCLYAAKESGRDACVGVWSNNPDADPDAQHRILHDLPALVEASRVEVQTSFEGERELRWKPGKTWAPGS